MLYTSLNIDHEKVGCGWRSYLVLTIGRKWVRLLSTDNAAALTISLLEYNEALKTARPMVLKRTRLAKHIREAARAFTVDSNAVDDALAFLRVAS